MNANELMIGDWYAFRGHPYKCTASDIASIAECEENGAQTDISEIPLTPEILEKNGFECRGGLWMLPGDDIGLMQGSFSFQAFAYFADPRYCFCEIAFVHQLQHALRLCGIEKEIEL